RHAQLTRAELESAQGNIEQALRHVESTLTLATKSRDDLLYRIALLTKAEALLRKNDVTHCVVILNEIAAGIPGQSPHLFAEYERILAATLVVVGDNESSASHRERSTRLYTSLRHAPGLMQLNRCCDTRNSDVPRGSTQPVPTNRAAVSRAMV